MTSRVVVVDSDAVSCKVLGLVLREAGYEPVTTSSGRDAVAQIAHKETDLAILSIELDDIHGFDLLKELRAKGYQGPVIFMSTNEMVSAKLEAFRLGADDFIVKPFDHLEMIARVQSVMRRFKVADQNDQGRLIRVADAELDVGKLTYKSAAVPPTVLTPTEMKILQCLMRNHGIVISRATLIERVWGFDFMGDTNRVDVYIRRVRRKIEADPAKHQYLHTVRGLGYLFAVKHSDNPQRTATDHHTDLHNRVS